MKTFRITLEDEAETVIYKAKGIADKYGASFEGDTESGSFNSNGVEGNYKITRNAEDTKNVINVQITKKPIVIPWQLVNATLSSFFGSSVTDGAGAHKVTTKQDTKETTTASTSESNTKSNTESSTTSDVKVDDTQTSSKSSKPQENIKDVISDFGTNISESVSEGLNGINWRFFQDDTKGSKKTSNKSASKDGVVDAEFTEANDEPKTPEEKEKAERREKAQSIIQSHVMWAAGSGFIPFPLADMAALTALQVGMLEQLANVYEIKTSQATGKGFIKALTGTGIAKLAAQYGASFLKTIPGIGTVAGGIAMSVAGGASTYALGQVVIEQFENERDLESVDIEEAKAKYSEAYEEGKDITEKIKKEEFKQAKEEEVFVAEESGSSEDTFTDTETASTTAEDIFEKIEKLGVLMDKGLISNEEFEAQKAKLLDRL